MSKFRIQTPHAAIIVWNYKDRIDANGVTSLNEVEQTIISTVSCVDIKTSKSKGNPVGTFQFVLAPTKNWVSTIAAGSWCVILMSNKPITEKALKKADPQLVKMVGKIETVRADTKVNNEGARVTSYLVSGSDWGYIFNNVIYIDNLLAAANDPQTQGNAAAVALRNALFGKGNAPQSFAVKDNLRSIINIFGNSLTGFTEAGDDINRLAKSTYDFIMPKEMADYFQFVSPSKSRNSLLLNHTLNLQTGRLTAYNVYNEKPEAFGYINPFSLQGTNTFWQILLDNSNPALNEMFNEIVWTDKGPSLTLFNRIKPFSYRKVNSSASVNNLRSYFYNLKTHQIDAETVISVNAGTNWRDKYNFIEIKPQFQEFNIIANWSKTKTQEKDELAFNREGFRPLIVGTKQFPVGPDAQSFDPNQLVPWVKLLREWYFDTHRLLNGTLVMTGTTEYIAVGNNIRFDAGLINPTPNINKATKDIKKNKYILAHVESVSHSFGVNQEGAREYYTTIQFVRGITVDENNSLVGAGGLDKITSDLSKSDEKNTVNVLATSEKDDPDPQKVKGN